MKKKSDNNRVLINAVSIRTGGSETFLRNILPLVANTLLNVTFYILIRKSRIEYYQTINKNVVFICIDDKSIQSPLMRIAFEYFQIIIYHYKFKTKVHWQIDEVLSPFFFLFRIKTIAVFHTTPMVFLKKLTNDGWLNDLYMKTMRVVASFVSTVPVCVSYHAKAELNGLYPSMRNRLRVIYHGVNHELYNIGKPDKKILSDYSIKKKYILSISNRFIWKNYYRLVQAFCKMRDNPETQDIDLVLIGEKKNDTEELRIIDFIKENKLKENVIIIPFIDQEVLHHFYKGALAYVFSSMEETFGLTILEAMASGIPVACANWGVVPEIAGTAAAYFDPLDIENMCQVISDVCINGQFREQLKNIGILQCRKFSWDKSALSYVEIIEEIMGKRVNRKKLYD